MSIIGPTDRDARFSQPFFGEKNIKKLATNSFNISYQRMPVRLFNVMFNNMTST
jgi:hypothetical protein